MEALLPTGLTAAIGVSNMSVKKLTEVLAYANVTPAINQVMSCNNAVVPAGCSWSGTP